MRQRALLLELNEISFDYVLKYCDRGLLPNFQRLREAHQIIRTSSERKYEALEPWIQWVTAHTGLSLEEHGVFRLGDIVKSDLPQIWEALEQQGLRVGALSPMNAKHRLRDPAFFVPDPWTSTAMTAHPVLSLLYAGIAQAVNDNAQAKLTLKSALGLSLGWLKYARSNNYLRYLNWVMHARTRPWQKAIFLDRLLADVFIKEVQRTQPDFASLFLNAGAHIQHHYMFSSSCYDGPQRNPSWYTPEGVDPVLEVYASYDRVVGELRTCFPEARLLIATGLHQVPHEEVTYYWRLRDHARFLQQTGIAFEKCEPRMSRDFLVTFADRQAAEAAAQRLSRAVASDGTRLFETDNRGTDVFVTLSYAREIGPGFMFSIDGEPYRELDRNVAFVAVKNGEHHGTGYLIDSAVGVDAGPTEIPLADIPKRIAAVFGLQFPVQTRASARSLENRSA